MRCFGGGKVPCIYPEAGEGRRSAMIDLWNTRPTPPADAMPTEGGGIGSPEHEMLCGILSRIEFHYLGYRLDDPQTAYKIFDDCYQALRELENFAMELVTKGRALQSPAPVTDAQREALEQADHAVVYAAEMGLDDNDYVEICPMTLRLWKTIRAALTSPVAKVDVEGVKQEMCSRIGDHHTRATHEAVREVIDHITAHYHLTPKTQEIEKWNAKKADFTIGMESRYKTPEGEYMLTNSQEDTQ